MNFLIQDGFSRSGTIPAVRGVHEVLKFRYRPALAIRFYEWKNAAQSNGTVKEQAAKNLANDIALLKDQLIEWSIASEIDEKTLARLHPPLLTALVNYVLGYMADEQEESEKNSSTGSA